MKQIRAASVSTVVMEATGVYWKPVYYALEGMFDELWLCSAGACKKRARAQNGSLGCPVVG